MPRLTEASSQARRDEIVAAAIRVMERKGLTRTAIADISAESGLSTGSIYSHFESKAQIALYAANTVIGAREENIAAAGTVPRSPRDLVAGFLRGFDEDGTPASVVLQMWAEASIDPEMKQLITHIVGRIRRSYEEALGPWVAEHPGTDAADLSLHMVALAQGYIVQRSFGVKVTFEEYCVGLRLVLGADPLV
ncbi:TetR/AcrR family transcriptional regulator [Microbacterium sp. SLBN-111]|uniref:TetR/AcrR family transcriptional regulator n=1 Tax=Microbacterium sp. SLBN-111 TaxID=3377733 RepID=UPI003C72A348